MARNPFEELEEMLERMSEQVEEGIVQGGGMAPLRAVPVDVRENDEAYVVSADLPGFETDDIDLTYHEGSLRIAGDRETTSESEQAGRYVRRERRTTSVDRAVRIPGDVDEDGIDASFSNGVLTVTLPKASPDADEGHRIDIE